MDKNLKKAEDAKEEVEEEEEAMEKSSSSEEEEEEEEEGADSEDDRLPAFMWGHRFRGHLSRNLGERVEEEEDEEEGTDGGDPKYVRKFFWTHYVNSGFPNRVNHAVAACRDPDGDYYAYSFGGYHADEDERTVIQADTLGGPFFKSSPIDVHCMDYEARTWSKCEPPPDRKFFNTQDAVRTSIPGCRYGHTACYYKGRAYMYGGRNDEDGSFSDVGCYDTKNHIWLKIQTAGDNPSSRDGHACTVLGCEMIIHGGFASRVIKFSGDMYAFNLEHHTWRKFIRRGERVPERDFHVATVVGKKIVVFGGRSDVFAPYFTANDIYPNDFYYYELEASQWFKCPKKGPYRPDGRRSLCAVAVGDDVLYFGGYNASQKCHYGDLFIVNSLTWECTEIRPFGDAPPPRRRVGCALIGSDLMICGGTSPVEVERDGKKREILHDHSDMFILHLIPTLEQLCITELVKKKMDRSLLPHHLQLRINDLLSKPLKTRTRLAQYENLG